MKAAVQHHYGPPEDVFAVEDTPAPVPKPDEVLLRVRAAGVNEADRSIATGKPYIMRLGYGLRGPATEYAGPMSPASSRRSAPT